MNRRTFALIFSAALGLVPVAALAGGKAGESAKLSFHLETDQNENPKMIFPELVNGKVRVFRRMSEVSEKDIESFNPFPASDGATYGLTLKLKAAGARRLAAVTATNPDRWLVARVNGRSVDGVLIDRQINDGVLIVWKGVTAQDIKMFDKLAPRIGETKKR